MAVYVVTLNLTSTSAAHHFTYLDSRSWNQNLLLRGENGIAALIISEVSILAQKPAR